MPQLKPHRAKQKQKTPKYTYRSLKAHMVISVLTSISFPIFTVFLLILGVLIFASISKYYTFLISSHFSSVRFSLSVVSDSLRPHELQHARPPCPSPSPGVHSDSCPSSQWCHPAISSCRPLLLLSPVPPSIRVFSNESSLRMRWPKYWSFSFSIIPSNVHPGLISFRMDWLDLLAVQGTLKSLLPHHSSKAPILWCSAFFTVQLSHPYMTTGKTIALTRRTFVGQVMSLFTVSHTKHSMLCINILHFAFYTQQYMLEITLNQ